MSAYTEEAAAKFYLQRAFAFYESARKLMSQSQRCEPAVLLTYEAMLDAAKALLLADRINADGCDAVLLALANAAQQAKLSEETHSLVQEAAQIHLKIHRRSLFTLRPQEADALIRNARSFLREVRDRLERKFGLIEGL
ncbi:MAG: hypothetical protein DRP63_07550 [Planctomycetota bacterium]|nr:MAG: hypothetical protein DRP63_07550 [Planctomycetota bacterium]